MVVPMNEMNGALAVTRLRFNNSCLLVGLSELGHVDS